PCSTATGDSLFFPTRRSSDLRLARPTGHRSPRFGHRGERETGRGGGQRAARPGGFRPPPSSSPCRAAPRLRVLGSLRLPACRTRSEEHTSELQSRENLVCRLL